MLLESPLSHPSAITKATSCFPDHIGSVKVLSPMMTHVIVTARVSVFLAGTSLSNAGPDPAAEAQGLETPQGPTLQATTILSHLLQPGPKDDGSTDHMPHHGLSPIFPAGLFTPHPAHLDHIQLFLATLHFHFPHLPSPRGCSILLPASRQWGPSSASSSLCIKSLYSG